MKRLDIALESKEKFDTPHEISREKLIRAAEAATDKLAALAKKYGNAFPGTCSVNYQYQTASNKNWEAGMYTGCYWLAYELTGDSFFREFAESQLPSYEQRFEEKIGMDSHDVGFVFTPSVVAQYKLTGSARARELALRAVEYFYEHSYSKEGKFIIRSWKSWAAGGGCRTMMDSMMNAPLLFWASEETGNPKYRDAALDHTKTTEKYLVREDGSTYHHYQFNPDDASPVRGLTFQGFRDDSCWSRGHAWGIYGFPIAYSYVKEDFIRQVHKDTTYFMLNHLPADLVPYWDYDFTDGDEMRDSSAAAIAVCGLNEMAKLLPNTAEEKQIYENAAPRILESVIDNYTTDIGVSYDGLIHHVTHARPQGQGFDECAVYGDYFYLEALLRYIKPDFKKHW